MKRVTVIAAAGATVRGPARLRLTRDQHALRVLVLGGKFPRGGVVELDGDQALTFKRGESFDLEQPSGRLNRALFEFEEDQPVVDADPAPSGAGQGSAPPDLTGAAPGVPGQDGAGQGG
jgi:hypothetical protein